MSELQTQIGKLISGPSYRDAIHIAVAPVRAATDLLPGDRINFEQPDDARWVVKSKSPIGIVDPFLGKKVKKGKEFYMFLLPNTITSLRHEWTHPAFSAVEEYSASTEASERWLRDLAEKLEIEYSELLEAGREFARSGGDDYFHMGENESYRDVDPEDWPKFWEHIETMTGFSVDDKDSVPFSCSC